MKRETIDQSKNGVRVIVTRLKGHYSSVDASCNCFGTKDRVHSNTYCPNLPKVQTDFKISL